MFDLCTWIAMQNKYAVEMARLRVMNNELIDIIEEGN